MKTLLLLAALSAAVPAAADEGCLFDGACGPRPSLAVSAGEPVYVVEPVEPPSPSRWEGVKKGASEGSLFAFFAALSPGLALVEEGFDRRMSRRDEQGGKLMMYGGFALAAVLYIPALVLGAAGGLVGGLVGAASPETVEDWDAEDTLFG
jgi:hypothetical protein